MVINKNAQRRANEQLEMVETRLRNLLGADLPVHRETEAEPGYLVRHWCEREGLEFSWSILRNDRGHISTKVELSHYTFPREALWVTWDAPVEGDAEAPDGYWLRAGEDETGGLDFEFAYFQTFSLQNEWIGPSVREEDGLSWIDLLMAAYANYSPPT